MSEVTVYARGRRAAERGAPCTIPPEYAKTHGNAIEWLAGYNSIYGGNKPNTMQEVIELLTLANEGVMDAHDAIRQALVILERLV